MSTLQVTARGDAMAEATGAETMTDEQVVERVIAGDVALFEILMRRNNTRIYRAVRSVLRDEAEAEDAMQAAYVRAFSHLATFRAGARFSTWLTQIALNEALGRVRADRRHPSTPLTIVEEPSMSSPVAVPPQTPEAVAGQRELAGLLERAVDGLSEPFRVVFMLRDVDGMDTAETAAALGVSEEAVRTRLSRARAALRDNLEQLVGGAASEAFGFHATRCDRVVASVMRQIGAVQAH